MNTFIDDAAKILQIERTTFEKLILSVVVILTLVALRLVIIYLVRKKTENNKIRYTWKKTSTYISVVIGFFIIGRIWFSGFQSLTTYFGLLSAGIAIALKDPLVNLVGWLFILWRRPLTIGDRVELGENKGDVIDLRIFQFTLMEIGNWVDADQSTGRVIRIPNGKIFTETLANYSKGFFYIWDEIPVLVTFESDWKKAKEILLDIGNRHAEHLSSKAAKRVLEASRKMLIYYNKLTPIVYTSVKDSGILLTVRFLCNPKERRNVNQKIWEDILSEFVKHDDIDFAYPTQRFYNNKSEGKPGKQSGSTSTE